ncbi:endonuclease/exonuclease/phosphatase family protein [Oceanitalea stevensii]|uniref:Endonuclease/exonuclease/phosphatase family protein n=1 Tax=Oceanitalea stevensii TaxID=2763072 RepID=A0ABR8Z3E3_9MICO|nr:endonuclease/exonuclease/phosphatase family protein [Oceanitalea stevensii]MBD8062860.1 endonuclease/exonuclease/phosphatase family protein [Oceanitalea stevensii]
MRLATFNILHGRSLVDDAVDLDRYARAVRALDADVLALQEVDRDQPRSHGADLTTIAAEAMGAVDHRFAATLAGLPTTWSAATGDLQPGTASYGVALLSRWPVRSWTVIPLEAMQGPVPVVFDGAEEPTMVTDEPRVAVVAVVETPEGQMTAVSTHLTFIPDWATVQLERLVAALAEMPRPAVLMGDLNMAGSRPTVVTGWRSLADALTFPVSHPDRQIDHILAEGAVRAAGEARSVATGLSDHRALVVDVERGWHG